MEKVVKKIQDVSKFYDFFKLDDSKVRSMEIGSRKPT